MAKRVFTTAGRTFTAFNAGAAATANAYMAVEGGSTTQTIDILEILFSGKVGTSTVIGLVLKRISGQESAAGGSALAAPDSDGPMHAATAALAAPVKTFITVSTTQPTPSNTVTDATLELGLNGFGGIIRWNAAPTQQWTIVGNAATTGESILFNNLLAGGVSCAGDAHILYEPY